jgi:hypothetical protein
MESGFACLNANKLKGRRASRRGEVGEVGEKNGNLRRLFSASLKNDAAASIPR